MKKIIGIMVSASVLAGTFVASLTASAAGQAGTSCNIKDYSTLYNCDFESGQTLSIIKDGDWSNEITQDTDDTGNSIYKIHKNAQDWGKSLAISIPLGSGIKAGTGKYVISYDLKMPGFNNDHIIQLRASENNINEVLTESNSSQLSIIKASAETKDTNMENNMMTASYNKGSASGAAWQGALNIMPTDGLAIGVDYWFNVKVVIDTTNGKAEYYYNDEYCGTQTADEFKKGINTLQLQSWQGWNAYGDLCIDNIKVQSECDPTPVISYDFTDGTIPANINGNNGAVFSDDGNNVLKLENASGGKDFMRLTLNEQIPANSGKYVFEYDLKYFDVVYNYQSSSFYCQAICGSDDNWYPMNSVREWSGMTSRLTYTVGDDEWDTTETGHNPNYSNWDNIRIIINTDNNTADYYFNDVYAGTQARTAGGNGYNTGINGFAFQLTSNTQNEGKVYIDNISLKKYNAGSFYVGNTSATNADGTATAKCVLINTGSASQKTDLIIAGYDASGRFTGVNWKTVTAGTDRLITTDSVNLTGTTADAIVKPFVWNSIADGVKIDR